MNFERRKRKSWSDSSGVSEIVGNLLILMITVVLFSSIIAFVGQMPVPETQTKADFSASVVFDESGTTANLTIMHAGGAAMRATMTAVILNIGSTLTSYTLSEDASFGYAWWVTGIEWTKPLTGISMTTSIIATVYDMENDQSVWGSQVSGGTGGNAPIVLQRYVDSDSDTPTADPIKQHDDFSFYAKIIDLDNDLDTSTNGVWVDASDFIDGATVVAYDDYTDGWFSWDFSDITEDVAEIDGKVLVTHARDLAGHEAMSSYTISVVIIPVDTRIINIDTPTGEGGLPSYISFSSPIVGHGFGVYGENITEGIPLDIADVSDPRTTFDKDENVFIRVASTVMSNVFGSNSLVLTDTRTGLTYAPNYDDSLSTAAAPFYVFGSNGKSVVFEAEFNTSGLPPSAYNMHIHLSSGGTVESVFITDITLIVQQADSPITFIPTIWLFSDETRTTVWGGKTTSYMVYEETHTVYASMKVQDAQSTPPYPVVGEIRIDDMTGGAQLYGTPPADTMITDFEQSTNGTAYDFTIDLRINNADHWLGGTNSYTLSISSFSDSNEGVYSLTKQVFVTASVGRTDFFAAADGIYSTRGGSTNFVNPEYVYYIESNNFFTTRVLHDQSNSPSAAAMYYMTCMAVGDIDGDGDDDLLAGQYKPSGAGYVAEGHLLYFENSMNSYGTWQAPSFITRADTDDMTVKLEWIATGDTNGDGDIDIAYVTEAHKIFIYNNTYGGEAVLFDTYVGTNDGVRKIALEDMNGDDAADLVALIDGEIQIYDLKRWDPTTTIASIPYTPSIASNIEDFDIADVNDDGMLDIITVDPTNLSAVIAGVWVNNYTENNSPTNVTLNTSFAPAVQWGEITDGDVASTGEIDENYLAMSENTSAYPIGKLSVTMKLDPLSSDSDHFLKVRARVVGGEEAFYVWYSVDSTDGTDGRFNPVIVITSEEWTDYSFRLPSSIADNTDVFIRITDSLTTYGSVQDMVQIDYIVVQSDLFGSYMQASDSDPPTRYQVVNRLATPYVTARAANIDGDEYLEVVVARNGKWQGYSYKTAIVGWGATDSYFYVYGHDMTGVSPTLFTVADVNGDSYSDVIAIFTGDDIADAEMLSIIGVFVNLYPEDNWYVQIKDLYTGMLTGTEQGSILYMLVEDIMHEQT